MRRTRWVVQRGGSSASTVILRKRLGAVDAVLRSICEFLIIVVGAADQGYLPLQCGRTPESS